MKVPYLLTAIWQTERMRYSFVNKFIYQEEHGNRGVLKDVPSAGGQKHTSIVALCFL